jgi:hypothetical protein
MTIMQISYPALKEFKRTGEGRRPVANIGLR